MLSEVYQHKSEVLSMPLEKKLNSGQFLIIGEFEPPKGSDFSPMLKNANLSRGRMEAILVPEMANAVLKAGSLGGCAFFQKEGIETILQICCRDRNRLALQADILSANALGVRNIMAVEGVDITYGDHPQARAVNDLDLIQLIEAIKRLESGKDLAGIELRGIPKFCLGSTINTGATGGMLEIEIENLNKKIDLGVQYVLTNPIFDLHRFQQFIKRIDMSRIKVIPTVLLLKSAGMARYIDRNMKGISVPSDLIRGIQKAPDKIRECIRIAGETISRLKEMGMAGVSVSTMGWEDKLPQVLDEAKL
jgi:methylenetetrahydrofolate reductase (NADPH)